LEATHVSKDSDNVFKHDFVIEFQRVTGGFAGGLKRLTSVGSSVSGSGNGSKVKKEEVKVEYSNLPQTIVEQSTLNHVAIVRDVVEAHYKNR
jgi:hypothetical protein